MKYLAALAAVALTCTACVETTDSGSSSSRLTGYGTDSKAGSVNGSVNARSGGGYTFVLSRSGATCTSGFDEPAAAGKTQLERLNCSGGGEGTATIVYGDDALPTRVVYAVNGQGGGTVSF